MTPYLSLAIWVPILAGVAVLVLGRDADASKARWTALAGALAGQLLVRLELDGESVTWHLARIKAKRARYAAESVAGIFGKRMRRVAESLAAVVYVHEGSGGGAGTSY